VPRVHARLALLVVALALGATGCGRQVGNTPAPTPADFEGIVQALTVDDFEVSDLVSGDPGCDDRTLVGPAISALLQGLDQATPVRVHFYLFRNRDAYQRRRVDVDTCLRAFIADPSAIESVDASPYVAAGQGPWGAGFREALRRVLIDASHIVTPTGLRSASRAVSLRPAPGARDGGVGRL